ncbi:MAG: alpha/beta fold hydrolase [Actinophytocola sp.]|nr:alpha/beta fold hydrolase [Actinophytocola sp.]
MARPSLRVLPTASDAPATTAVVLVLHGGKAVSRRPTSERQLSYWRMASIAESLHDAVGDSGAAVWLLRNRLRGWNEPVQDAVVDVRWALAEARRAHPGVPIVLVGHSMGARAALRVAGTYGVAAICALAPWIEPREPVRQLAGRSVLIAHGDRDRWTMPSASFDYADRARRIADEVGRFEVRGVGHTMLRRSADWTAMVCAFVAEAVGAATRHPAIDVAMRPPAPDGLRTPLPAEW